MGSCGGGRPAAPREEEASVIPQATGEPGRVPYWGWHDPQLLVTSCCFAALLITASMLLRVQ